VGASGGFFMVVQDDEPLNPSDRRWLCRLCLLGALAVAFGEKAAAMVV